jgi:hypothetical protein
MKLLKVPPFHTYFRSGRLHLIKKVKSLYPTGECTVLHMLQNTLPLNSIAPSDIDLVFQN